MRFQHMQSWFQVRQGKLLCSRYDYIFGLDLGLFETLIIRDLFFFKSYHFALRSRMLQQPTWSHSGYLRG